MISISESFTVTVDISEGDIAVVHVLKMKRGDVTKVVRTYTDEEAINFYNNHLNPKTDSWKENNK
jgi:hypothetical protein